MRIFAVMFLVLCQLVWAENRLDKLTVAAPMASVGHPFLHMIDSGELEKIAKEVEFVLWKNPDELRALVATNKVDFVAVPSNVAALLFNRGVDIRLVGVSTWGILDIVSRDPNIKKLEDLKGKELIVPFKNDMPDLLLQALIKEAGISDITIKYLPTPSDAMQHLILRRSDNALLAEPATSMAFRKTKSFPVSMVAPDLYRSFKLEGEWARVMKSHPRIPQAAIAVVGDKDPKVVKSFWEAYKKSTNWYLNNKEEAGKLVSNKIAHLTSEAVSDSISHIQLRCVDAVDAKEDLINLYNIMLNNNPKMVGSKLPDDRFYFQ